MILSTDRIRQLMHDDTTPLQDRLFITPILDWDKQARPGSTAIDVRLGQRLSVPRRSRLKSLDHLAPSHKEDVETYRDEHHVLVGDHFVLHPRQFALGETLEWIHLPRDLAAYVIGRSAWGRDGLIIATATGVHAGYFGVLTLEITNLGEIPLLLYPGLTIAQLFIHTVETVPGVTPTSSSFAGSIGPGTGDATAGEKDRVHRIGVLRGFRRDQH